MLDKKLKKKYQYVVAFFYIDNHEYIYHYLNKDLTFTTEFDPKKAKLYKSELLKFHWIAEIINR